MGSLDDLTAEHVRAILDYNPDTGVFRWRWRDDWRKNENARWAGKVAGNINRRGYVRIGINGRSYLAHRLAWFFIYGEWPQKDLDHIDGDPGNNHIANLRLATRQENTRNRQKNKNNTAGVPGVSWCKRTGKFLVQIKVDGKRAYDLVRSGEKLELKKREVSVYRFDIKSEITRSEGFIDLEVEIDCSSGTYIRALARDLGEQLGVGGHLTRLRRTRVGQFDIDSANQLSELDSLKLIDLADAAGGIFERIVLSDQEVIDLGHGKKIPARGQGAGLFAGVNQSGKLVAVLEPANSDLKSVVVFQGELND
jgi:hypothetical protein